MGSRRPSGARYRPSSRVSSTSGVCVRRAGGGAGCTLRTLVPVLLTPDVVLPALRGAYGREYHWAEETATTQRLLPPDATHGAVALAERQTEGRGRLGRTWSDSALMFSVTRTREQTDD